MKLLVLIVGVVFVAFWTATRRPSRSWARC
jgi:hypothetical protein